MFHKVTIAITGIKGPDMFDEVQKLAGNLYLKGTDDSLFADVPAEQEGIILANLNSTPGIHAKRMRYIA